ncbi:contact-dependent growth inhibition system immunity protein [Streptomyces sp. JL3001]|uniref:contact-dependent growth inhibition system immunity protein n=1 Tax=Streptomyces sp. JL3001 TaxID=3400923 RepID=UPI003B28AD8A
MSQALPPGPRFHELSDLLEAYTDTGYTFSDTAETPGPGLASYLRIAARNPARATTAIAQIDDLLSVGLFSGEIAHDVEDLPRIRPPMGTSVEDCLRIAREHLRRLLQDPSQIPQTNPQTVWEWNERLPELSQFLGGYLHQNYSDFHATPDDAIDEYVAESAPEHRAQAAQEITELLTMVSSDQELDTATTALGLDLLPPQGTSLRRWLELIRRRITVA